MSDLGLKMFVLAMRAGAEVPDVVYVLTCEASGDVIACAGFVVPRASVTFEWTFHELVEQTANRRPAADLIVFTAAPVTRKILDAWVASDLDPAALPHSLAWAVSDGVVRENMGAGPVAEA